MKLQTRRDFSVRLATIFPALGLAGSHLASAAMAEGASPGEVISHNAESIHQEVAFKANPKRVYNLLTDVKRVRW